ncbi:MAG: CoA transferase [Dehalococcoidia bacterium]|nr:CoA transferase [Dehalococcoidia bacterium]
MGEPPTFSPFALFAFSPSPKETTLGQQALSGIRILDFSWYAAGPIATRFFAHHGAEVIKVESKSRIDGLRFFAPFAGGTPGIDLPSSTKVTNPNLSGYFNNFNANKFGMRLNLSLPKGREIAKQLIRISDIVIDNFTPGVMEKWGLTSDEILKIKSDAIVASLPMMGMTGPYRNDRGFGFVLAGAAGVSHLSGMPDDPPVGTGTNYPDYSSNPCHAAVALLSALRYRNRTGRGQFIELSQLESTVQILETAILDYTVNGRVQSRTGNSLRYACPHGVYRCLGEDRWCALAVFTDSEWASFCQAIGRLDLVSDPQLGTLKGRLAKVEDVDRIVAGWTATRLAEEVMESLQRVGVAAGIVQTGEDALDKDPQLAARGNWVYLDHPEAGRTAYTADAFKLSETPGHLHSAAPCMGQHTGYVCGELLGMTEDDVRALAVEKVLY